VQKWGLSNDGGGGVQKWGLSNDHGITKPVIEARALFIYIYTNPMTIG